MEAEETFEDVWRRLETEETEQMEETFGDIWRRLKMFGDGVSLEVQLKLRELFDMMVVTVGKLVGAQKHV